jgi:hypothetical protein
LSPAEATTHGSIPKSGIKSAGKEAAKVNGHTPSQALLNGDVSVGVAVDADDGEEEEEEGDVIIVTPSGKSKSPRGKKRKAPMKMA